jgi:hypothetical protein
MEMSNELRILCPALNTIHPIGQPQPSPPDVLDKTPIRAGTLAFGLCDLTHKSQRTKKQFLLIPLGRILFFFVTQEALIVESFCERHIHKILKMNLVLEWIF